VRNLEDKKKLYIGNLPYSVNSDELRKVFSEFGEVVDAVVISDKYSGRSKGFGFVTFATEDAAKSAAEKMNGKDMGGRNLVVNVARPPKER
jgi:RNA recognition motif-containing protein